MHFLVVTANMARLCEIAGLPFRILFLLRLLLYLFNYPEFILQSRA